MMEAVNAVPLLLYIVCVAGLAVALLGIGKLATPRQFIGPVQKMPYESGMDPIHDTRRRFDVRFNFVAIAFLVFDVELLFLYPWAVASRNDEGVPRAIKELRLVECSRLVFAEATGFIALRGPGCASA